MPHQLLADLPDLFAGADGGRVRTAADWRRRRGELADALLGTVYGRLPPAGTVRLELLHRHHPVARLHDAFHYQYRVVLEGGARPFWFLLDLLTPRGDGAFPQSGRAPVVLCGDGCWKYASDEVAAEVLGRGWAFATFNRTELAPDCYDPARDSALYQVHPGLDFGAIAAWAWGYHRAVDALASLPFLDAGRIAVVGHSRGGKAALLAGATDERIALTAANDSGCGGAGCFRWLGEGCERIEHMLKAIPYWFAPALRAYAGREQDLPTDLHALKALCAPRPLLTTEALGDLWANPTGTCQTHRAAREVWRFLGAEDRLGHWYRPGGHTHGLDDWRAFLDFAGLHLLGRPCPTRFDLDPFPAMADAFAWKAP